MQISRWSISLLAGCAVVFSAGAQETGSPALGKKTFESFCIVCHGPTGGGSPLGVPLNGLDAKMKTDSDLIEMITKGGGPGSAMSSYESGLTRDEIFWTMLYIRELQGESRVRGDGLEAAALPEQPALSELAAAGEGVFREAGGCIQCHSYRTQGGLLGSDLTIVAHQMTPEEVRVAVLQPNANINPAYATKELMLSDGTRVNGRFRFETINSIQIANEDATLWRTYFKSDIKQMRDGRTSLMPADYGVKLTEEQQTQLFAFLDTLK